MNEPKSAHQVILASIQAEDDGVTVNWKQTLLHYHEAATGEINRLTEELQRTQEACADTDMHYEDVSPT